MLQGIGKFTEKIAGELTKEYRTAVDNDTRPFSEVWGKEVEDYGFLQVPVALLAYPHLEISEKLCLLQIMSYGHLCWTKTRAIAIRMGVSETRVQQIVRELIKKGFLLRYVSEIPLRSGIKRKIRIFDWKPAIAKIKSWTNEPEVLTFLTKSKHFNKKKCLSDI